MDDVIPMALLAGLYFMPTLLAIASRSAAWKECLLVNLLVGWTVIGWLFCLVACLVPSRKEVEHRAKVNRARDEFFLREQTTK